MGNVIAVTGAGQIGQAIARRTGEPGPRRVLGAPSYVTA